MAPNHKRSILAVDDSPDTLEVLQRNLTLAGYIVFTVSNVPEAIKFLESNHVDLVITDLKMPKFSGLDLVRHIRENYVNAEVMMITGYATVKGAVEAVKIGAEEYLTKPFTEDELLAAVHRSMEKLEIRMAERTIIKQQSDGRHGLIGRSKAIMKVFDVIEKASRTSATVQITGESGTGKELVARAIHYNSARSAATFVPVNCGGIPEGLLESELFGYVKGAFTGAVASRAGFFQTAEGGSIFLDEIGETTQSMQVKLLRVLQSKEVCMVGSNRPQEIDVRIIAATNKDMYSLVKKGAFREDLFYRLNVINIALPPLRERGDDILILAFHFLSKFAKELDKTGIRFTENALKVLKSYSWPGNIRELENLVQSLVVMANSDVIDVPDLPTYMRFSAAREVGINRTLAEVESEHIRNVLAGVDGNKSKAAEILGIDRKTLRRKLSEIELLNDDEN